jgi:hypothetical protein
LPEELRFEVGAGEEVPVSEMVWIQTDALRWVEGGREGGREGGAGGRGKRKNGRSGGIGGKEGMESSSHCFSLLFPAVPWTI